MNLFGIELIEHPLLAGWRSPILKLRHDLPVSDKFRAEFDAWLLAMFGDTEVAFILPNKATAFVSPKQMAMLKGLK